MTDRLYRLWHRVQHWLGLEPCQNFTERRDGQIWHYVVCVECGERVLEFPQ